MSGNYPKNNIQPRLFNYNLDKSFQKKYGQKSICNPTDLNVHWTDSML